MRTALPFTELNDTRAADFALIQHSLTLPGAHCALPTSPTPWTQICAECVQQMPQPQVSALGCILASSAQESGRHASPWPRTPVSCIEICFTDLQDIERESCAVSTNIVRNATTCVLIILLASAVARVKTEKLCGTMVCTLMGIADSRINCTLDLSKSIPERS